MLNRRLNTVQRFIDSSSIHSPPHRTPATGAPVGNYSEGFCHFNSWEWRRLLKCVNFQATLSTKYILSLRLWYFDIGYFIMFQSLKEAKQNGETKNIINQKVVRWYIHRFDLRNNVGCMTLRLGWIGSLCIMCTIICQYRHKATPMTTTHGFLLAWCRNSFHTHRYLRIHTSCFVIFILSTLQ